MAGGLVAEFCDEIPRVVTVAEGQNVPSRACSTSSSPVGASSVPLTSAMVVSGAVGSIWGGVSVLTRPWYRMKFPHVRGHAVNLTNSWWCNGVLGCVGHCEALLECKKVLSKSGLKLQCVVDTEGLPQNEK